MQVSEYSKNTDRTTDVQTQDQTPFSAIINGHPEILKGLTNSAFIYASPIQVAALPTIIAGNDTIVEAKNGTGKTLTFVIPTLMRLKIEQSNLQAVILAPTREIAVQIQQCFKQVGQHLPELKCEYFIGGTSVMEDKEKAKGCQIAVGSPGRIKHLLNEHVLNGSEVKSFILDEIDRMFSDISFTKDIRLINAKMPNLKQMIVASASIDKNDMSLYDEFMKEYTLVKGADEDKNESQDPSKFLLGIKQYVACVKAVSTNIILLPAKNVRLLNILQKLPYTQCIIFTNYMTRVEAVCNMLRDHHYKADYIRGDQDQTIRLKLVERLKSKQSKILVATDLIARGISSSNVDLVINIDCPNDWATYLHRIGRAGRFGNRGYAFTILDDGKELESFKGIINSIENVKIKMLPIAIQKPILEYADNELEDLNLTTETDILANNITKENEKNITKENEKNITEENENDVHKSDINLEPSDIESNASNSMPESNQENNVKSIYRSGVSEEESLQKLCQVVKETEKQLIDNDLINKRHLTEDRSFVLFNPEPFLDDTEQYSKYSPQEIVEIITKYDSDFEMYEAAKKLISENCILQKNGENELSNNDFLNQANNTDNKLNDTNIDQHTDQNSFKEKLSINEVYSENNSLIEPNTTDDIKSSIKIDKKTCQKSRFSNIYDLFQIPDFSLMKPAQHANSEDHLADAEECVVDKEEIDQYLADEEESDQHFADEEESDQHLADEGEIDQYLADEGESDQHLADEEESDLYSTDEEESDQNLTDEEESDQNLTDEEESDQNLTDEEESDQNLTDEEESDQLSIDEENYVYLQDDNSDLHTIYDEHEEVELEKVDDEYELEEDEEVELEEYEERKKVELEEDDDEEVNDEQQLVDYELLNDWYRQWKRQINVIQKCVRMSR